MQLVGSTLRIPYCAKVPSGIAVSAVSMPRKTKKKKNGKIKMAESDSDEIRQEKLS